MRRRESQHFKNKAIIGMAIKEEKVDIMTLDDREVIMQEYPGNSCHIISDNITMSICLLRYINASEFIMDIDVYIKLYAR